MLYCSLLVIEKALFMASEKSECGSVDNPFNSVGYAVVLNIESSSE